MDNETRAKERQAASEICQQLSDQNERLRALIHSAEFPRTFANEGSCPWCDDGFGGHKPKCEAFSGIGRVR